MDSCQWYMGCGRRIVGTPGELADVLLKHEHKGKGLHWRAEPKLDGQWLCVTGRGPGRAPHCVTRTGRTVDVPCLVPMRDGVRIVGEHVGPTFYVFDLLTHGRDMRADTWAWRCTILSELFRQGDIPWPYRQVAPQVNCFAHMFARQSEGLVLKRWPGGPYVAGKSDDWVKVKRAARYDVKVVALAQGAAVLEHLDGRPAGKVDARGWPVAIGQTLELEAYKLYESGRFRSPVIKRIRAD